jgi:mono/diheme cytochrome c family protein
MNHRHLAFAATAAIVAACADNGSLPPYGPGPDEVQPPNDQLPPDEIGPTMPKGPQPSFGAPVSLTDAPPPLSGGTLLVTRDGKRAVAADPDRDRVYVVTLADKTVLTGVLDPHDEPGRVVEDASGRAHVVLRRGGGIATIDVATGVVLSRRHTCAAPRGIAFDAGSDRLLVTCESGEIMAIGTAPDAVATTFARLDRDLRDIVIDKSRMFVSRFRAAEVLELGATGAIVSRTHLSGSEMQSGSAILAWRMIPAPPSDPSGEPIVVHESASTSSIAPSPGGYGGGMGGGSDDCMGGSIVKSVVSRGHELPMSLPDHAVLPVDLVFDGTNYAVVAAGNGHTQELPQVFVVMSQSTGGMSFGCTATHLAAHGQLTSIALRPIAAGGGYVVQSREPAQLELLPDGVIIPLANTSREDTGHAIFHSNSGSGLACASCHGEAGDDGHVWTFDGSGPRRTPSLRGTLQDTAPYHWGGEMTDLSMLVDDVMTGRMNGPSLDGVRKDALQSWLFALPGPVAPAADAAAVDRGRSLFQSSAVGCASCHSGPRYTTAATVDVGTGGSFQVPSLVGVGARAPYLHDGCAATLKDRFGPCGGTKHGSTSQLTPAQIDDLVSYLNTL